ncbi:MAG: hypothetical protein RIE56_05400 [Amphiplicatus sp.]
MTSTRRSFGLRARLEALGWRKLAAAAAVVYLVLFQVFAVAHASSPEALSPDHGVCVLCAAAHRADDAVAPELVIVEAAFEPFDAPTGTAPAIVVRRQGADPPARGPPIV